MTLRVEEYVRADGSVPYRTWFESLDPQAGAKVTVAKVRLSMGNTSSVKWFEGIGEYAEYKARKAATRTAGSKTTRKRR